MYRCNRCNKDFEKRHSYIGHCSSHNRGDSYKKGRSKKERAEKDNNGKKKICIHCGKKFENPLKLGGHQTHCLLNPNKPLTLIKLSIAGKRKKLSKEHKEKISTSRKKYLDENPGKIPYLLNHSSKESYPEGLFKKALIDNRIKGWEQEFPFKRYSLDFAFVDLKIDIEIDGSTHNLEKVKIIDIERTKKLKDEGWEIIRFSDYEVKKEIDKCIEILKKIIFLRGKQV